MGKIAFVFAGQGSQFPGMGQDIYDSFSQAAELFDRAETLRPGTKEQCFKGPEELLMKTENTQPCLFTVELAAAAALKSLGIEPDMSAGFSLGEVAALSHAGYFGDFDTGFSFVCSRANAMEQAAQENPGSMAAVLKLDNLRVENLAKEFKQIYPVNYNCPGQLVVAGASQEMESFCARVKEEGGRAVPLKVGGGFHSPFMTSAAQQVKSQLEKLELSSPAVSVYSNVSASPYEGNGQKLAELLYNQVKSPVRWQETVESMVRDGAELFIEIGPGKTLCGLIKKIYRSATVYSAQSAADIYTIKEAL